MALQLPDWANQFRLVPARCKAAFGGRGSGKTLAIAGALVLIAASRRVRIACGREFQSSIEQSAKKAVEWAILQAGMSSIFDIQNSKIFCNTTGSEFFFIGFERNREAMRGWQDIDYAWIEEAQRLTQESHDILLPSVRKEGSEIWFSFNPYSRADPVWQDFCSPHPRADAMIATVNWMDNPWFPDVLENERQICLQRTPELYDHVWMGATLDDAAIRKVLPYTTLEMCVDAHLRWGWVSHERRRHAGLDVADTGGDSNAAVFRDGPLISRLETWISPTTWETAVKVNSYCTSEKSSRLYYDGTGVGSGIRGYMAMTKATRQYSTRPINFGAKVAGPKREYSYRMTNETMFARRNSQLAWSLRLRAENTKRRMNNEDVPLDQCLFIDSSIPDLESYLLQLSQPEWRESTAGKIVIDKAPNNESSPDKYDATVLAFARDSAYGLTLPK